MYSEAADFVQKTEVLSHLLTHVTNKLGQASLLRTQGHVLEIGGSGGLLSGLMTNHAHRVICSDVVDTGVVYEGQFAKLLSEKFQRNGFKLDLSKIEFHAVDAQDLIYRDEAFDFVFSLNAIEHIPNPVLAIQEVFRVLKPGGVFYAEFDPIWTADTGSHFAEYSLEPWSHLLCTDDEFCKIMASNGATKPQQQSFRSDMNRKFASYYKKMLPEQLSAFASNFHVSNWKGCTNKAHESHANRKIASLKFGLDLEDLLIRGFRLVAQKSIMK